MTKIKIIVIVTAVYTALWAQNYKIDNEINSIAIELNDLLVNCKFDKAYELSDELLRKNPDQPLFYYLSLASIGLKALDFDEIVDKEKFNKIYEQGMEKVNLMLKSEADNCDLLMIKGFLMSTNASFMLIGGKYASGINAGSKSLDVLRAANSCDGENYDVEYYLGFYNYAQAELRRRLGVLFWLPKNSENGIAALEKCVKSAKFMNRAAEMVLADVFVREGKLEKTNEILPGLLKKYPESRFLLWTKMRYEFAAKDDFSAINTAVFISKSYLRDGAFHNAVMVLEEARKMSGMRKFPKEIRNEISESHNVIDKKNLSNSDARTFNSLTKE
ncbi:MAG: hypothetical protein LBH98_02740 [Chitinispirillales bacterium]|nr:hypothetical protein [Chitinispirillales bacterium]